MAVREALNRHPKTIAAAVLVLVAGAVYWLLPRQAAQTTETISGTPQAWFTTDDGQTWFRADINKLVPFDYNGKQAFRCYVWTCDGGKTKFVSHLERHKQAVLNYYARKGKVEIWELPPGSTEVKPAGTGDRGWVDYSSPQSQTIVTPRCPGGKGEMPQPVDAQQAPAPG